MKNPTTRITVTTALLVGALLALTACADVDDLPAPVKKPATEVPGTTGGGIDIPMPEPESDEPFVFGW